jgi:hypothetical protein
MTDTDHEDLALSAGERAALGEFRSFHPAASGIHKVSIAIASIFTVLLMGGALWCLIEGLNQPGKGILGGAALFGGLGLLPAAALIYVLVKLRWRLYLFENGFVLVRGSNRVVLWDDVQSFYEEQLVVGGIKAERQLRFLLKDGRRVTVDNSYKDFPAFAEAVRQAVTEAVLSRAAEELPAGRAIAFGKLKLSQAGLEKEGDSLAWADVHSITIEPRIDGQVYTHGVVVYKRGPQSGKGKEKVEWYLKYVPSFGNVGAFLHLASRFTRVVGPDAGS